MLELAAAHVGEILGVIAPCVQKVLFDFKLLELQDSELDRINNIVGALKPMAIIVHEICRRNATILTAAEAFDFAIEEISVLKDNGNVIAEQLVESLKTCSSA